MKKHLALTTFVGLFAGSVSAADPATNAPASNDTAAFPVTITVDAAKPLGEWNSVWRFFGADEPNYAYMKDGRKLLGELGTIGRDNGNQVYFRTHHLLTSGDGSYALKWGSTSAYKEDANGNPVYDWTINDRIFDAYLAHGIKPYVQLGFMPEALTTHPEDYPRNPPVDKMVKVNAGQAYPPKDYEKWGELAYQWAKHCVERYGAEEVEKWYWQVWNEPNIVYWRGTREEFFKLHDYGVEGVRRALPTARVGGPDTAGGPGGTFLHDFLEHCARGTNYVTGKTGSPLDFISFHAKGSPGFTDNHVRMGMANQLQNIDDACAVIASFPEFKHLPIVIGESDPEGCAACREPRHAYRNGTMYSSYTAASFPRKLEIAAKHGVKLEGALTWAFTFEDQPPFAGFRQLASAGLDLPVLNVFRMFGKMSGQQLAATSSAGLNAEAILEFDVRGQPDVSAWASGDTDKVAVLVWHYHDDDVPGPDADVDLRLAGVPFADGTVKLTHYRVDADHSNSFEAWKKIGSPSSLSAEQYPQLEKAGRLAALDSIKDVTVNNREVNLRFRLPRQGVSLLVFEKP